MFICKKLSWRLRLCFWLILLRPNVAYAILRYRVCVCVVSCRPVFHAPQSNFVDMCFLAHWSLNGQGAFCIINTNDPIASLTCMWTQLRWIQRWIWSRPPSTTITPWTQIRWIWRRPPSTTATLWAEFRWIWIWSRPSQPPLPLNHQ